MNGGMFLRHQLQFFWIVCILAIIRLSLLESANATVSVRCIESERLALLNIKKNLEDQANLLSSWTAGEEDCCRWNRVGCDNQTGHVVRLDLQPTIINEGDGFSKWNSLMGEISSSLLELPYLSHLDLSNNGFEKIPDCIGSLSKLTYLNLSFNSFSGSFPYQIGNLSKLQYLDLSWNSDMKADSFEWLERLASLRVLHISFITFSKGVDWLKSIKTHPSLSDLVLHRCQFLETNPSSISHVDSSKSLASLRLWFSSFNASIHSWLFNVSITILDLQIQDDQLKGPIPDYFGDMKSLVHLDLSYNQLEGGIPKSFGNLCHLKTLDLTHNNLSGPFPLILENLGCSKNSLEILKLSENQLRGSIPDVTEFESLRELYLDHNRLDGCFPKSFKHFSKLRILNLEGNQLVGSLPNLLKFSLLTELHMANNELNGSISGSIGELTSLQILDASSNNFVGVLSDTHLSKLSKLQQLDLSYNSLTLNLSFDRIVPFQFDTIKLRSCKLGPQFPTWLRSQRNFSYLDISNCKISDAMPSWFWNLPSKIQYLNLSFNNIYGEVPNLSAQFYTSPTVDLSSNLFYGPIPQFLSNTIVLDLSKNMFTGSLSFLCTVMDSALNYLDLSTNMLSGGLPDCWTQLQLLVIMNLENNDFSGIIPNSMGSLYRLQSLRLRNNSLTGELPSSLQNCSSLELLDLGENKLTGKVSTWVGESLRNLIVLRLRSNEFYGNIPSTICRLSSLQIMDISFNDLSGSIPSCLNNLTAMAQNHSLGRTISHKYFDSYNTWSGSGVWSISYTPDGSRVMSTSYISESFDYALVMWKGYEQEYGKNLGLLKLIDLSNNNLTGGIPGQVTTLLGLISLTLSRNSLTGSIPEGIGQLKAMEVLDLSHNQLSGKIPGSIADISSLSVLDLSNNQLTGRIPKGTQLQGFSASAYSNNSGLCGLPLLNECPDDWKKHHPPGTGGSGNNLVRGEEWIDRSSLYAAMGIGFAVGFWGIWGPLLISNSWRRNYFQFLNNMVDRIYLSISLKLVRCGFRA